MSPAAGSQHLVPSPAKLSSAESATFQSERTTVASFSSLEVTGAAGDISTRPHQLISHKVFLLSPHLGLMTSLIYLACVLCNMSAWVFS